MFQGSMIRIKPASVLAAASHCLPRTRSPRISHDISSVQIGMEKMSTAVFPGPPSTSAHVWKTMKPATCVNPMTIVSRGDGIFNDRPLSLSAIRRAIAPPMQRSAAKAKGWRITQPLFCKYPGVSPDGRESDQGQQRRASVVWVRQSSAVHSSISGLGARVQRIDAEASRHPSAAPSRAAPTDGRQNRSGRRQASDSRCNRRHLLRRAGRRALRSTVRRHGDGARGGGPGWR